jgi:hypothetical protein
MKSKDSHFWSPVFEMKADISVKLPLFYGFVSFFSLFCCSAAFLTLKSILKLCFSVFFDSSIWGSLRLRVQPCVWKKAVSSVGFDLIVAKCYNSSLRLSWRVLFTEQKGKTDGWVSFGNNFAWFLKKTVNAYCVAILSIIRKLFDQAKYIH